MKKQVTLSKPPVKIENISTVKNEKISIQSATIDIPFDEPDVRDLLPLRHVFVTLHLSDGSEFKRGFDLINGCNLENYVQMAIGIHNQYVSINSPK